MNQDDRAFAHALDKMNGGVWYRNPSTSSRAFSIPLGQGGSPIRSARPYTRPVGTSSTRRFGRSSWLWTILSRLLSVIAGIVVLVYLGLSLVSPAWIMGIGFVIYGVMQSRLPDPEIA
jgi:hypothetical protein